MMIGSALMQKGELMRLIDADAMKRDLLTVDPQYQTMIDWCITVLDAQPTIEPELTRKWTMVGKWIIRKNTKNAMCPSCHKSFKDVYDMDNYDHYCRHCGLAMDGIINE